jgi:choline dehydrogenase-like flavoprotein
MAYKSKPAKTEVVIIGAGASGAAAAKVLCEAGVKVVALEKGPWRSKESFGGDELANINRYNLWPDPLLNPRTWRQSAADEARSEMFCPVPQMVGGGTVHWQGWLPRFTANDFRMRTVAGELQGASLADWPITYDEIEPYYLRVEWAFGVSGAAGANAFESQRSGGYPCPPMPMSRYAQKFMQGCDALGWNAFPTPQAALSRLPNLDRLSSHGWIDRAKSAALAESSIQRLRIKTASRKATIRTLSGGNAQKVVIAKWLASDPDVLILDEPTAGIDIGSKSEIVTLIRELAKSGKAILVLSSELQELLAACDRILVMSEGRVVRDIARHVLDDAAGPDSVDSLQHAEQKLNEFMQEARGGLTQ